MLRCWVFRAEEDVVLAVKLGDVILALDGVE
jgi:hypothetical protein